MGGKQRVNLCPAEFFHHLRYFFRFEQYSVFAYVINIHQSDHIRMNTANNSHKLFLLPLGLLHAQKAALSRRYANHNVLLFHICNFLL